MERNEKKVKVEVNEEKKIPVFSNVLFLHVNESEFILDFGFFQPQEPVAEIVARVATTPFHAKRFLMILENSIKQYEQTFGEIKVDQKKLPLEGGVN